MTARLAAMLALAAVGLAGCANPYAAAPSPPTTTTTQAVAGEQPGSPVPSSASRSDGRLPRSAVAAVRRAAELTGTWTAKDAAGRQQAFAQIATGQARDEALQAAARLPTDPLLAKGDARSRATVEAISLRADAAHASGLVVTHEHLSAGGVSQDRWRVTLVETTRQPGGWAINDWRPQE